MSQTCPNCGSINRATNRFCSNCGVTLASPATSALPVTTGTSLPAASGGPTSQEAPVTYVVQRWDTHTASTDAPSASSEAATPTPPTTPPTHAYPAYGSYTTTVPGTDMDMGASALEAQQTAQPASPTAPDRKEGGIYAPYSPEAARQLEAQKPERSWLIPSLVAAALLLLILVGVGGFLLVNGNKNAVSNSASTQGVPSGAATQVPSGGGSFTGTGNDADTIKQVIKQSNDEQIKAWHQLDTEVLKGTRTGQVLTENVQAVEQLRQKGMYAIPENKSIVFGPVKVSGNTATAQTIEVWTVVFYSQSNNKVVLATGPDTLTETYHLVKQDGKWLISGLDIQNANPPTTTTPAPNKGTSPFPTPTSAGSSDF